MGQVLRKFVTERPGKTNKQIYDFSFVILFVHLGFKKYQRKYQPLKILNRLAAYSAVSALQG